MQFLKIAKNITLSALTNVVGSRNVDSVLAVNNLVRTPNIGQQLKEKVDNVIRTTTKAVAWQVKSNILNTFTDSAEIFEAAALASEDTWKVLSALGTFPDYLKMPESVVLPHSVDTLGGEAQSVSSAVYTGVMASLKGPQHFIDARVFNDYSTTKPSQVADTFDTSVSSTSNLYSMFQLPWGEITLYSSLADASIDFPVYPEEIQDGTTANFGTMPDTLYQYEPWYNYQSSGPRQMEYNFHFHRDMWSGDHRDGKAAELVNFCKACCYPEYNGSSVIAGYVTLYIHGEPHIHGIMTACRPKWSGPIGLDGFYLECNLSITITEVSEYALNFSKVRSQGLIGGQR